MAEIGNNAAVFAEAFIKAHGIQIPGRELDENTRQCLNEYVLKSLAGAPTFVHEPTWMIKLIGREIDRAHSEASQAALRDQDSVVGFNLAFSDQVTDKVFCMRIASTDLYGLGKGIFPKDEIVVLPPGCDQVWWEVVHHEQIANHA